MSNVSNLEGLLKLACDGVNDGIQIAQSGGKNYFLDFSLASSFVGEVLSNLSNFSGAIAEAKGIDAAGLSTLLSFFQANFPSFGSPKFEEIIQAIVSAVAAIEPIFNASSAVPVVPVVSAPVV